MEIALLKEILEKKASGYLRLGFDFAEAVNRAMCELLAGAEGRLPPEGMFCLRACLVGAGRDLAIGSKRPERN